MDPFARLLADLDRRDGDQASLLHGLSEVYPLLRERLGSSGAVHWLVMSNMAFDEARPIDLLLVPGNAERVRAAAERQTGPMRP